MKDAETAEHAPSKMSLIVDAIGEAVQSNLGLNIASMVIVLTPATWSFTPMEGVEIGIKIAVGVTFVILNIYKTIQVRRDMDKKNGK